VTARLLEPAPSELTLELSFRSSLANASHTIAPGSTEARFEIRIPEPRLWTLEDPYLYDVDATATLGEEWFKLREYRHHARAFALLLGLVASDDEAFG